MILDDDVLKQALVLYNEETMNQIPDIIGIHNYSYRFEKKIKRIRKTKANSMIIRRF